MKNSASIASGWAIARGMWLQQRRGLLMLASVALGFGILARFAASYPAFHARLAGLGYLAMSLSLLVAFVMCSFTEADRKRRSFAFPTRLFTLPVSTATLVAAPMCFGVILASLIYVVWARFGLTNRELPLTWPLLYVAVAMICYQTIVWSLARLRILRIVVLGYVGAILAMGWMAFRGESDIAPELSFGLSQAVRETLCWILAGAGAVLFCIAWAAVEAQRRGGGLPLRRKSAAAYSASVPSQPSSASKRSTGAWTRDFWPRRQQPFNSPAKAQFWYEWRRHGRLLPLATGGVLLMIMAPGPFVAPVSAGMTILALAWILATPLLISFVIGKGLGKADLWSNAPGMPPFLAVRPLTNSGRIGAKIKMAGVAALSTWALIAVSTSIWLYLCCDRQFLTTGWTQLQLTHSGRQLAALVFVTAVASVTLTFRLLAGSLYVGLSGQRWLVNAAACWVFIAMFGGLALALACQQKPSWLATVFPPPEWLPAALMGLFGVKAGIALLLATYARRQGWTTGSAISRYFLFWSVSTALLIAPLLVISPTSVRSLLVVLCLYAVPLLRISLSSLVLAGERRS